MRRMDQAVNAGRFQGTLMPISERPTVDMIMTMNLNNNTHKDIFFKTFVFVIHKKKHILLPQWSNDKGQSYSSTFY